TLARGRGLISAAITRRLIATGVTRLRIGRGLVGPTLLATPSIIFDGRVPLRIRAAVLVAPGVPLAGRRGLIVALTEIAGYSERGNRPRVDLSCRFKPLPVLEGNQCVMGPWAKLAVRLAHVEPFLPERDLQPADLGLAQVDRGPAAALALTNALARSTD